MKERKKTTAATKPGEKGDRGKIESLRYGRGLGKKWKETTRTGQLESDESSMREGEERGRKIVLKGRKR